MSILNSNLINIQPAKSSIDCADFKENYRKTLTAPLDGYWENAIIGLAPHYQIKHASESIGYCVISEDKQLLQLYVHDNELALVTCKQLVATGRIKTAVAGTNDALLLTTCLRITNNCTLSVNTYLFQDDHQPEFVNPLPNTHFRLATLTDLDELVLFYGRNNEYEDTDAIEEMAGNHRLYAKSLIENKQVFLLTDDETIFGIGECRFSQTQPPFADVGMIVNKQHRRQNIGTYILTQLKNHCYQNGRKPICSCDASNIASYKTIEKTGFINSDRLLNINF